MSEAFNLAGFFPYQVRVFSTVISETIAQVYGAKYGLSVSEWRTMAILGSHQALSASEIVARSSMDKVSVSRAVQSLRKIGYLKRDIDGDDRRKSVLRLTEDGQAVFASLIPLVREVEKKLLEPLEKGERAQLAQLMQKVQAQAFALQGELRSQEAETQDT
ncbi:MarR family winged helix-turn-helix transcriptional regulator [Polycladidibacter hongkongensis]|uniref:MarR family winged helix-turn-helix transcriptional regulator n=1 Tax=Polycladidibacter hongkongensis TaxID=1647556 RepID=UPI000AA1C951|nr:MarR family winged helix-turn-helix transcriptional regulator [Pseudovibrio hongkongensis]